MITRKRRSDTQWQTLIEQQQESGLSAFAFCQQHGLSSKTFYKRRTALQNKAAGAQHSDRFIKVRAEPATRGCSDAMADLHYQNTRLQFPLGTDASWVAELMKALS